MAEQTIYTTSSGTPYVVELTDTTPADVPVYNPNNLMAVMHYSWIYTGKNNIGEGHTGRYVPAVGTLIDDKDTGFYYVTAVDPGTLLSTLAPWSPPVRAGATAEDFMLGVGPRFPSQGYFIYVNNETVPAVLNVDSGFYTRYPGTKYFRIFAGNTPLPSSEVISGIYNADNTYTGDRIPAVQLLDANGLPAWVPDAAWSKRQIVDGEPLVLVGYTGDNVVTGIGTFVGRNTAMVRPSNSSQKLISSVQLAGPSVNNATMQVKMAVNATIDSVVLMCLVTYANGDKVEKPIDGTKIRLITNGAYMPTSPDINQPATLIYTLDVTEAYEGFNETETRTISTQYTLVADPVADAYGFKLFSYPSGVAGSPTYGWKHYLHDIDHGQVIDVSNIVSLGANSKAFDPTLYGTVQELTFAIDVHRADPAYNPYVHAQTIWATIYAPPGDSTDTNWTVLFEQGRNPFGQLIEANITYVSSGVYTVDLTSGAASLSEWLTRMYTNTRPIYNSYSEGGPLDPTHFIVTVAGVRKRFALTQWSSLLQFEVTAAPGQIVPVHFTREVNGTDLYLATAGCIVRNK